MPARLFRRIQSFFSRLNRTLVLSVAVFAIAVFFIGGSVFAATKDSLDTQYSNYLNNFTTSNNGAVISGISGGTVQNSTTNNTPLGLVFTVNIGIDSSKSGDTIENHWGRVAQSPSDNFLIELCNGSSCWLNTIAYTNGQAGSKQNTISQQDSQSNYNDAQTLVISAFSQSTTNSGTIYTYNPSSNTAIQNGTVTLPQGVPLTASLWYCANGIGSSAVTEYKQQANITPDNPKTFDSLCGGFSYFRIGQPLSITIPTDLTTIQQQTAASQQTLAGKTTSSSTEDDNLPKCGVVPGIQSGTINGCIAQGAYYIYYATAWIAGILGKLFDFFIGYSLSDSSYRYTFAVTGWKLVRDISNIFFIIIMVWTGFSAVFGIGKTSMKSIIPNLIINALLINFSLFATRIVIDISNITARIFYSQMVVCDQANIDPATGTCSPAQAKRGLGGYWPLSEKIVGSFNPQKMFTPSVLTPPDNSTSDTATSFDSTKAGTTPTNARDYANYFGVICLIAAFIMVGIAVMFFKVTFLFLGRVVGLYICMIFSPFAFLSRDMPMLGGVARLKWNDWVKELSSYAMLAPVFVFFLYIIYVFLSSNFVQQIGAADTTGSFFGIVLSVAIPMLIIYFMMDAAQKAADSLSGDIGKGIQKFGTTVTGLALGAATGGASLIGSRVVGGGAKRLDESRVGIGIRNMAARSGIAGWTGRTLQKGLNASRSGSFDVRQTTVGQQFFNKLGVDTNQKPLNALAGVGLGLGTDQRKGGLEADIKRRVEDHERNIKLLDEKSGEVIKNYNDKHKKSYDKKVNDVVDAEILKTHTPAELEAAKKDKAEYIKLRDEALNKPAVQQAVSAVPAPTYIKSPDELSSARRKDYTENLTKEGYISEGLKKMAEKGGNMEALSKVLGFVVGVASIPGMAAGAQVREDADKIAAKKIEEKTKADKELQKIEETLKKGFRDLIAVEVFQKNYDLLSASEKASVEARETAINATREQKEQWEKRVQAVELSKYNLNELKKDAKKFKDEMIKEPTPSNVAKFFAALDEVEEATKHEKIWRDIGKYREDQKKKIKGEENK